MAEPCKRTLTPFGYVVVLDYYISEHTFVQMISQTGTKLLHVLTQKAVTWLRILARKKQTILKTKYEAQQ